jgi:hypothetical protein
LIPLDDTNQIELSIDDVVKVNQTYEADNKSLNLLLRPKASSRVRDILPDGEKKFLRNF